MTRKWVFLVPVLVPLLFLATISTLDFNFLSYYGSSYCPSNNSVNWLVTSGRLNLVQKTALESIFVHNPNVCLNIFIKEKMDDTVGISHDVKRLQNDHLWNNGKKCKWSCKWLFNVYQIFLFGTESSMC